MTDKVLSADTETWLLIPAVEVLGEPYGIGVAGKCAINELTDDLLNEYLALQTRGASGYSGAGGNITTAVKDDAKLALTDSETDKDKAINASGNSVVPTSQNYDAQINTFRDKVGTATDSTYNSTKDAIRARGVKYIAVRRIGAPWTTSFSTTQKYNAFYVETDNPIDGFGDGTNQTLGMTFVPKSVAVEDCSVAAGS